MYQLPQGRHSIPPLSCPALPVQPCEIVRIETEDGVIMISSVTPDRERSRDNAKIFAPVFVVPRHTRRFVFELGKYLFSIHRILPLALAEQDRMVRFIESNQIDLIAFVPPVPDRIEPER